MGLWDWLERVRRELDEGPAAPRGRPLPRPGAVPTDQGRSNLPAPLHALVRTHRADIAGGILRALAAGKEEVTVGLGPAVDVPLLPDDLVAADVTVVERDLVVLGVRWTQEGWMLVRDTSSFGVFWAARNEPKLWNSVRRCSVVSGLAPGDLLGLGSCPGDSLVCRLPAPPDGVAFAPPPDQRDQWELEERLRVAVSYWRYATLSLGPHPEAVVGLPPAAGGAQLRLHRNLDAPSEGWRVEVEDEGRGLALAPRDGRFAPLRIGRPAPQLVGAGHRLRFGKDLVIHLPPCMSPQPRFDDKNPPSRADIREVLGLGPHDLEDAARVRAAWKDAARRFHPDKVANEPGATSRFVEARACWEAWQRLGAARE